MSSQFKKKYEIKHHIYSIVLQGSINDTADFGAIPTEEVHQVHIDLDKVKYINSTGIKKWIMWTTQLKSKHKKVELFLSHCRQPIVDQINSVRGFLPAWATVKSFYVPFHCEVCNASDNYLYRLNHEYDRNQKSSPFLIAHPKVKCPNCKTFMDQDFVAGRYFAFLMTK